MKTKQNIALLLAGGKGCRMHLKRPKQFMEVAGKPLIAYTLQAFETHKDIDIIHVVCDQIWEETVQEIACKEKITKFKGCFPSGETSMLSLYNGMLGLEHLGYNPEDLILTHDSVRPLVSEDVITNNLETCLQYGNAITAIQSNEAYMISTDKLHSEGMVERERLFRAQTPQTFSLKDILPVIKSLNRDELKSAQSLYTLMAKQSGMSLHIAQGDNYNFKVTVPADIEMIQAILYWRTIRKNS